MNQYNSSCLPELARIVAPLKIYIKMEIHFYPICCENTLPNTAACMFTKQTSRCVEKEMV